MRRVIAAPPIYLFFWHKKGKKQWFDKSHFHPKDLDNCQYKKTLRSCSADSLDENVEMTVVAMV